jgi:hypothetical protein
LWIPLFVTAQEDLLAEIDTDSAIDGDASTVFKEVKFVNFKSIKLVAKKRVHPCKFAQIWKC